MSNNAKTAKNHVVGALGAAFRGVKEELKELEHLDRGNGIMAKGVAPVGMAALGSAVNAGGAVIAAGSVPVAITALLPALTIVGVGAGIGIVLAAGIGVGDYVFDELEASKKRKG